MTNQDRKPTGGSAGDALAPGGRRAAPVAPTSAGAVRGYRRGDVAVYRGIPYGSQVSGGGRFQPAGPPAPWSGVRHTTVSGPRAVQDFGNLFMTRLGEYFTGGHVGELGLNDQLDNENCLVLNVLTPSEEAGSRPVMVYIHGGGYTAGSGVLALGAERFVREQDVVLVSVNHRLNVFGFCALGRFDERFAASANVGLLDLVLALEWVKENIGGFGGDAGNVTIFGESGGGGKVSALMAMPAASGLFHKAVIESGSFLQAIPHERAERDTHALLGVLGLDVAHIDQLLELDARELFSASKAAGCAYGPVIDGLSLTRDPFQPDAPSTSADIPLLLGHCDDEMSWFFDGEGDAFMLSEQDADDWLAAMVNLDRSQLDRVLATYRAHDRDLSPSQRFFRILSDATFGHATNLQAERKAAQDAPVFKYRFSYRTAVEGGIYGAFHTAELPLVLRLTYYPETEALSRLLATGWATFARSANPSQPALDWPRFTQTGWETMIFDTTSGAVADPHRAQRKLWEQLPAQDISAMIPPSAGL